MSAPAALPVREDAAPDLLVAYAEHVQDLAINPDAKRICRRAAEQLLAWHLELTAWMVRPTAARLAAPGLAPGRSSAGASSKGICAPVMLHVISLR